MKQTIRNKCKHSLTLLTLMFLFVSMFSVAIATTQEDLILQARYGHALYDQNVDYAKDTLVIYDGEIYNTLKLFDGKQTGINDTEYFINIENEKYKPPKNTSNVKEIKTKDDTKYTGEVSIKGVFDGTETFLTNERLLAIDNYTKQDFEVVYYTGTHGIEYSIYHYDGMTDDKILARRNGTFMFNVISDNGFISYITDDFTTQTASIPDIWVHNNGNQYNRVCLGDYFTSYNPAYTEVSLWDIPSGWDVYDGDSDGIIPLVKESYFNGANPNIDVEHTDGSGCTDGIDLWGFNGESGVFEVNAVVSDDLFDYDGDAFYYRYIDDVEVGTGFPDVALVDEECISLDMDDYFLYYEEIDVEYTDGGAISLTGDIYGTDESNNNDIYARANGRGTSSFEDVAVEFCGNSIAFDQTITLTGRDHFNNEVQTTFDVVVTTATPPSGGSGFEGGALVYYSFDDTNLSGSNPLDLTSNSYDATTSGASTGKTGIIDQAFYFDGNDDVEYSGDVASAYPYTMNAWIKINSSVNYEFIMGQYDASANDVQYYIGKDNTDNAICVARDGSSIILDSGTDIADNGWHMITCVFTSATDRKIYVDGTYKAQSVTSVNYNANVDVLTIGSNGQTSAGNYLTGSIDEVSIHDFAFTSDNVTEIYNTGSGTQYPYGTPLTIPPYWNETIGFLNPMNTTVFEDFDINLPYRWSNYDNLYISFIDPDDSTAVNITELGSYSAESFFVSITDGLATFSPNDTLTNSPLLITFQACNTYGCNQTSVNMTIDGVEPPTFNNNYFPSETFSENESWGYNLDYSFTNYNGSLTNITFKDAYTGSSIVLGQNQTHTNSYFTLGINPNNFVYVITSTTLTANNDTLNQELNFTVCNNFNCTFVEGLWLFSVTPEPEIPPYQIQSFIDTTIEYNESISYDFTNYFTLSTYFIVNYTHPVTGANLSYNGSGVNNNTYFYINFNGDNMNITSKSVDLSAINFVVGGCNINGCTFVDPLVLSIFEPVDTNANPINELFDDMLGSGTTKSKLFVGICMVFIFAMIAYFKTDTIVGALAGGSFGLFIAYATGLFSMMPILLIIGFALAMTVLYKLFDR